VLFRAGRVMTLFKERGFSEYILEFGSNFRSGSRLKKCVSGKSSPRV
jgi:hypothetical protein